MTCNKGIFSCKAKQLKSILILFVFFGFMLTVTFSQAEDTVKIGAVYPLSGGVAEAASWDVEGIKMAVEEINTRGGIPVEGKNLKIELVLYDSKCDPTHGVAAVEKMIHRDKVIGISGDYCSHAALAEREISNKNKVVQIALGIHPKITEPGYPYMFRTACEADDLAEAFVEFIDKMLQIKTLGLLVISDDYGRGNVKAYETLLADTNIKIVAVEYFKHGDTDFYTQVTKIMNQKPDAIYITTDEDAQNIGTLKQIKELGYKGYIFGSSAYGTENMVKLGGKELLENLYIEAPFIELIKDRPEVKDWLARYKKRWGREGNVMSLVGYQTIECLAAAIKKANSLDGEKIREAMHKINLQETLTGFMGEPYFDETGQVELSLGAVKYQNGKMVVVYRQKKRKK